jgi:V/A-type H+-transporting ATPase subunit D
MADSRQPAITRIAQLELKDERRLVNEGYDLLDEKRIRLVVEIRAQLQQLRQWQPQARKAQEAALGTLKAALGRHGLEELAVYPPLSSAEDDVQFTRTRLFGLDVLEVHWRAGSARSAERAINPSPEAHACALAYRDLLALLIQTATCCVNLRRLMREYVRTERRARAIENVILPEIDSNLKFLDEQLEILDQEEIARVRQRRGDSSSATHAPMPVAAVKAASESM